MTIQIKHRRTGKVLFTHDGETMKEAVVAAVNGGANLGGANLDGANLGGANLDGANLGGANLDGANLGGANLGGANLDGANLDGAYLDGANLDGAYLGGAYLDGANLGGANLDGANLDGAYLGGANLDGANLGGANLDGANLGGANLDGANLGGANLDGANLGGAYLDGANLGGANLDGANLGGANLDGANLGGAYLGGAYLDGANLDGANLQSCDLSRCKNLDLARGLDRARNYDPNHRAPARPVREATAARAEWKRTTPAERAAKFRERNPDVPVVPDLDKRILEIIESGKGALEMGSWHDSACNTTHCRGGWSVHLAGPAGYALEAKFGGNTERAARAIYRASTGRVPWFFDTNEGALDDIRRCAREEAAS